MINQENITEYDKDFLDNKINIGDSVIFEAPGYRKFVLGKVITKALKSCQIEYINDWNYEGRTEVVRQGYGQIIKNPLALINRQKAELEKLRDDILELSADISAMKIRKSKIKAEARKEFAEELRSKARKYTEYDEGGWDMDVYAVEVAEIDNLLEEMEQAT